MLDGDIGFLPGHVFGNAHFLQPGLVGLPTVMDHETAGRCQYVGNTTLEVDMAVTIGIDPTLQEVGGKELDLADLTRPGADHFIDGHIATIKNLESRKDLRAEFFRPPAVEGQGGERSDGVEISHITAKIGFQPPEGGDDRSRHTVALLHLLEDRRMLLHERGALVHAVAGNKARLEIEESLGKNALGPVPFDDRWVIGHAVEDRYGTAGNAHASGFFLDTCKPAREFRGIRGDVTGGGGRSGGGGGQKKRCGKTEGGELHRHANSMADLV